MSDEKETDYNYEFKANYTSYKFPLVLKLAWGILIVWGIYYSLVYAIPDLRRMLAE